MINEWKNQNLINSENENSFLIGYRINLAKAENQIFAESVSYYSFNKNFEDSSYSREIVKNIPLKLKGNLSITVRNVGQGNWNEVNEDDKIKIVYDAGASILATKNEIRNIIGTRCAKYLKSKPILFLSHWDKDHYHCLLGMTDAELSNFSLFVCRDWTPTNTSEDLLKRITNAIGVANTFTIPAEPRVTRRGYPSLIPITSTNRQVMIYNAQYHRKINVSGIVLSVKTGKSSVVLSGDCLYKQISDCVLPHLNFPHSHNLVVPHHGGNAGKFIYNLPNKIQLGEAIISVGANIHKHPKPEIRKSLISLKFKLAETNIVGRDITINL